MCIVPECLAFSLYSKIETQWVHQRPQKNQEDSSGTKMKSFAFYCHTELCHEFVTGLTQLVAFLSQVTSPS